MNRKEKVALAAVAFVLLDVCQAQVIRFETLSQSVWINENAGTLVVGVVRDGPNDLVSKVSYELVGRNPVLADPAAGQFIFGVGEIRHEINLTIRDNGWVEWDQLAGTLALSGAEGATFDGVPLLDIKLRDNEFERLGSNTLPVLFCPHSPSAPMGGKEAMVALRRLGASDRSLTVHLATADQSAKAGVHYVAQSVAISFAPLETEKTIPIPLLAGPIPDRKVSLELLLRGVEAGRAWTNRGTLQIVDMTRPGTVDISFDAGELLGSRPQTAGLLSYLEDMIPLPDGRIYIGGHLHTVQGTPRDGIARLLPNGRLDSTFQEHGPQFFLQGDVHQLFLQPDGRLLGGYYGTQRFYPDGTGDAALTSRPNVIALLPGGKLLAHYNGLFCLNSDGTPDPSFKTTLSYYPGHRVLVEPDGKILLSAWLETERTNRLVRLLPDGQIDPIFSSAVRRALPNVLARQPDGRYLLAGWDDGSSVPWLVRLHPDGTLDPSFTLPAGLFLSGEAEPDRISDLAVQHDGKILVAGYFMNPRSPSYGGLLRLNTDGSLDSSFDVGLGATHWRPALDVSQPGFINRLLVQPDGQILAAGYFTEFDGVSRAHLVRLNGDSKVLRLGQPFMTEDGRLGIPLHTGGRPLESIAIQAASSLEPPNWTTIDVSAGETTNLPVVFLTRNPADRQCFFRAVSR